MKWWRTARMMMRHMALSCNYYLWIARWRIRFYKDIATDALHRQSYATSLTSSVTDYKWVHGRRFHSYHEGSGSWWQSNSSKKIYTDRKKKSKSAYKFPNDEKEQDRLDMFHHMFKLALGGKLFLAPLTVESLRVLDIGTGTGIWAIELGIACSWPTVCLLWWLLL